MQYPPRRFRDQNNNPIINQPDGPGPDVLEALPDDIQTFSTPYDLVHFDLDPLNGKSAQVKYIEIYIPQTPGLPYSPTVTAICQLVCTNCWLRYPAGVPSFTWRSRWR